MWCMYTSAEWWRSHDLSWLRLPHTSSTPTPPPGTMWGQLGDIIHPACPGSSAVPTWKIRRDAFGDRCLNCCTFSRLREIGPPHNGNGPSSKHCVRYHGFILVIAFCAGVLVFCFNCVAERLFHSRVLRPPGGGSNISLGADEEKPPVRKNKMASSVFAEPEDPYANRRNNPPGTIWCISKFPVHFTM